MVKSLAHVLGASQWLEQRHVLALDIVPPPNEYKNTAERDQFYSRVLQKVKQLPGVKGEGFVSRLPLQGERWGLNLEFREAPRPENEQILGDFRFVSTGYFQAIGLLLVKGRLFSADDRGKAVALISENVARRVLPGRNPIGMHLAWWRKPREIDVIGVVANVRTAPDQAPVLAVYLPMWSYNIYDEAPTVASALAGPARRDGPTRRLRLRP